MSHEETRAFATHYFLLKLKSNSICEWQVMLERLFSVKFNERVRVSHFFRANATTSFIQQKIVCSFFLVFVRLKILLTGSAVMKKFHGTKVIMPSK